MSDAERWRLEAQQWRVLYDLAYSDPEKCLEAIRLAAPSRAGACDRYAARAEKDA